MASTAGWHRVVAGWYRYTNASGKTLAFAERRYGLWDVKVLPMGDDSRAFTPKGPLVKTFREAKVVAQEAYLLATRRAIEQEIEVRAKHRQEQAQESVSEPTTCAPAADAPGKPVAVRRPAGGMSIRLIKMARRLIAAARTIAQALVSAVRGRQFRLLVDLYRAIDGRLPVHIGYVKSDGTTSERVIEPRDLAVTAAGNITVRAFDRRDGEDTTFRVDRITSADFQRCA